MALLFTCPFFSSVQVHSRELTVMTASLLALFGNGHPSSIVKLACESSQERYPSNIQYTFIGSPVHPLFGALLDQCRSVGGGGEADHHDGGARRGGRRRPSGRGSLWPGRRVALRPRGRLLAAAPVTSFFVGGWLDRCASREKTRHVESARFPPGKSNRWQNRRISP